MFDNIAYKPYQHVLIIDMEYIRYYVKFAYRTLFIYRFADMGPTVYLKTIKCLM